MIFLPSKSIDNTQTQRKRVAGGRALDHSDYDRVRWILKILCPFALDESSLKSGWVTPDAGGG